MMRDKLRGFFFVLICGEKNFTRMDIGVSRQQTTFFFQQQPKQSIRLTFLLGLKKGILVTRAIKCCTILQN